MKIVKSKLKQMIAFITERLNGDWVLLGGAVLPLLGISMRYTEDIRQKLRKTSNDHQRIRLRKLLEALHSSIRN